MKYEIYQVVITKEESDEINRTGNFDSVPKYAAKRYMMDSSDVVDSFNKGYYTKVAEIEADDLDHVFAISNQPYDRDECEARITRIEQMYSVSVNDIIKDSEGNYSYVAPVGFEQIAI